MLMRGGGRVARGGLGSARRDDDGEWGRAGGEGARRRARAGHGTVGDETVAVGFARARPCACVGVAEGRKRKDVKNV